MIAKKDALGNYLSFDFHAKDTAGIMNKLCLLWLPRSLRRKIKKELGESWGNICKLIALLHDIGKITLAFQNKITLHGSNSDPSLLILPHAKAGEAILEKLGFHPSFSSIIGAHHGVPQDGDILSAFDEAPKAFWGEEKELWEERWQIIVDTALHECGFQKPSDLPIISMPMQTLLTGLIIMADWLASNQMYFPLLGPTEKGTLSMYPERINNAWEKISLCPPWEVKNEMDLSLFHKEFGFDPYIMQKMMLDIASNESNSPGIFILEASMGGGKTEAALAAAEIFAHKYGNGGIYFGLPTQATANGLFSRIEKWGEYQAQEGPLSIRLAHRDAALNADWRNMPHENMTHQEGLLSHSWMDSAKKSLLSDFVVGTIDQLLMASLQSKHLMLRHLGLAGKVVIIDEVHSYSPYMNIYLDRTLTWLGDYNIPVIILSATLPEERRKAMVQAYLQGTSHQSKRIKLEDSEWQHSLAYPLITWTDGMNVKQKSIPSTNQEKRIVIEKGKTSDLPMRLKKELANGGCAGVIVNTVHRAQKIAAQLKEELPDMRIIVSHSQFLSSDRAKREKEILDLVGKSSTPEKRNKVVVVGTQTLEQSLDIDFDILFTDLCPMDLLLQRIGRLFRHKRIRPDSFQIPRCIVMECDRELEGGARAIYGEWLLMRTKALLPSVVLLPHDISVLVQKVYQVPEEDKMSAVEKEAWQTHQNKIQIARTTAEQFLIAAPKYGRREQTIHGLITTLPGREEELVQAKVRDGLSTIDVLVVKAKGNCLYMMNSSTPLNPDVLPSNDICRELAIQKLRLPARVSKKIIASDFSELDNEKFKAWRNSPWLEDKLFLIFDANNETILNGIKLHYDPEIGLII